MFGSHDSGQLCNSEDVTLLDVILLDKIKSSFAKNYFTRGNGSPVGGRLVGHPHHVRLPIRVDMGQVVTLSNR